MAKDLQSILNSIKTSDDQNVELLAQLNKAKSEAQSAHDGYLMIREKSHGYYDGSLPGRIVKTIPYDPYNENVLLRMIDDWLPQQVNAFISDRGSVVSVRTKGFEQNEQLDELITYNLNRMVIKEGKGKQLITNVLRETALDGLGITKSTIQEKQFKETATVKDWTRLDEFYSYIEKGWEINPPPEYGTQESGKKKGFEWKTDIIIVPDPQTGLPAQQKIELIKGKVPLNKIVRKSVREFVNPEDIYFDISYGCDTSRVPFWLHRVKITRAEAKQMGFTDKQLEKAEKVDYDLDSLASTASGQVDYMNPLSFATRQVNESTDPEQELIYMDEYYIKSSYIDKDGETKPYQIIRFGEEIARITAIKEFPFDVAKIEEIIGNFFGRSFYARAKQHQDRLTRYAQRAEEMADKATWNRYKAVKQKYDRQSVLNNRAGAVIEVDAMDAFDVLPNVPAGADFYQGWQEAQGSALGSLRASLGADVSGDNLPNVSPLTIAQILTENSLRNSVYSETFVQTFLDPFWRRQYRLLRDEALPLYDKQGNIVEGVVLPEDIDLEIDYETTNDTTVKLMNMEKFAMFAKDISSYDSSIFTYQNKFALLKQYGDVMQLDTVNYTTDPSQNVDPEAESAAKQQLALQNKAMKLQVDHQILENRKRAEEIGKLQVETKESVLKGEHDRKMDLIDKQIEINRIQAEAQYHDKSIVVDAMGVQVKNKAVENETNLALIQHATDITTPTINGVR